MIPKALEKGLHRGCEGTKRLGFLFLFLLNGFLKPLGATDRMSHMVAHQEEGIGHVMGSLLVKRDVELGQGRSVDQTGLLTRRE